MEKMYSSEFIERIAAGQKNFDGIEINYADLSGRTFHDLHIKNSRIMFSSLRNCKLKDVVFEDCEMLFAACGFSEFISVRFIKCKIDYSGFTGCVFDDSEMTNTTLSWVSFIDADISGLKLAKCPEFRVVRSMAELTSSVIEGAFAHLGPLLQHLDSDTRSNIEKLLKDFERRYDREMAAESKHPKSYGRTDSGIYSPSPSGYKMFDAVVDSAIKTYGHPPYKKKGAYDAGSKYS